jgi:D-alanyl-lipoteichoic acid acyltransferase DltB (MBOAT superfamily)
MPNFSRPLSSKSVTEFWRKWHITLSSWFADYFYTPITIAKREWGKWSVAYAFFVTFIVLGFWHGANWTFIIFGALQGTILTIEFFTKKFRKNIRKQIPQILNNFLGISFTICFFAFTLIFFKSNTVSQALFVIKKIFTDRGPLFILKEEPSTFVYSVMGILSLIIMEAWPENYKGKISLFQNEHWLIRQVAWAFLIIIILLIGVFDGGQFIYYKF